MARDLIFTSPVRSLADSHSKLAPTWRYYFDYTGTDPDAINSGYPTALVHGAEIVYFLDTGDFPPTCEATSLNPIETTPDKPVTTCSNSRAPAALHSSADSPSPQITMPAMTSTAVWPNHFRPTQLHEDSAQRVYRRKQAASPPFLNSQVKVQVF